MKIKVLMKSLKTGELKQVKLGFSWTLLFFSGFLGMPLFLRKLNVWGGVFLALWAVNLWAMNSAPPLQAIITLIFLVLQIWLAIKGNEMTAKNYLELGWEFAEPESEFTKMAKRQWGILV